jgi:hypothetical protein
MTSANAEKEDAEPEKGAEPDKEAEWEKDAEPDKCAEVDKRELIEANHAAPDKLPKPNGASPVRIKVDDDLRNWMVDHPDKSAGLAHLLGSLATTDFDFADGIINQLLQASMEDGSIDERKANFMLSIIKGIAPRDPVETMLAAQMSRVYIATMDFGCNLSSLSREEKERTFNRLTRTFVAQMEALKRYRSGREQNVTVQNVLVRDGSQAVVGGNINVAGRDPAANLAATASPPTAPPDPTPMPIDAREDPEEPVAVPAKADQKQ